MFSNADEGNILTGINKQLTPQAIDLLTTQLKDQLLSANQYLCCYDDDSASVIIEKFREALVSLPLTNLFDTDPYVEYMNNYPEAAAKILIGKMDQTGILTPPLTPTGLTAFFHEHYGKTKRNFFYSNVCSANSAMDGMTVLYEVDLKKLKHFNNASVIEYIAKTMNGIQFIQPSLAINSSVEEIFIANILAPQLDPTAPLIQSAAMLVVSKHYFKFSEGSVIFESLHQDDIKRLYTYMEATLQAVFNSLNEWEKKLLELYGLQWAYFIAGHTIGDPQVHVSVSGIPNIQFTRILEFSFQHLIGVKRWSHIWQTWHPAKESDASKPQIAYTLAPNKVLKLKQNELIELIINYTHEACGLLLPLNNQNAEKVNFVEPQPARLLVD